MAATGSGPGASRSTRLARSRVRFLERIRPFFRVESPSGTHWMAAFIVRRTLDPGLQIDDALNRRHVHQTRATVKNRQQLPRGKAPPRPGRLGDCVGHQNRVVRHAPESGRGARIHRQNGGFEACRAQIGQALQSRSLRRQDQVPNIGVSCRRFFEFNDLPTVLCVP